jgi:hypothetical protein
MKPLSEQLSDLSERAKKTEDVVAAARERNRANLQREHDRLKASIDENNARANGAVAAAQDYAENRWNDARASVHDRFASLRDKAEDRRADRDIKRAQHRADEAEQDAADAVDFALYVLDEAEYAIVDAVLARADADELVGSA